MDARELVSLDDAARSMPGGGVARSTVWSWCRNGFPVGRDVIRLEYLSVGRRMFTTRQWVEEFGQRIAEAKDSLRSRAFARNSTSAMRIASHDDAKRMCEGVDSSRRSG